MMTNQLQLNAWQEKFGYYLLAPVITVDDGESKPAAFTGTIMTLDDGKQSQLSAHLPEPSSP
jgi:hypothetical protein